MTYMIFFPFIAHALYAVTFVDAKYSYCLFWHVGKRLVISIHTP